VRGTRELTREHRKIVTRKKVFDECIPSFLHIQELCIPHPLVHINCAVVMVGVTVFLTAVLAAQSAVASAVIRSRTSYAVKERHNVPRKWKRVARAPSEGIINLNIALKQSQFDELERHLYEGMQNEQPIDLSIKQSH
jgi:hypothetical protein